MSFGFNWAPQRIPTQMKGTQFAPQKVGLDQDFPSLVNGAIGRSPEEITVEQNLNERQVGNANDMANWIQQGGTPQADAAAAAQAQAQQQEAEKQMRIKEIEAEIAEIEQRIAERKRGMAANEDALNTQLAAIEARKINQKDPTSIWRWKATQDAARQQRVEDLARAEAEKEKSKAEQKSHVQNKLDSYLPTMTVGLNTSPEQAQQYLNTLAGLEAEASNYGIDDPRIAEIKSKLSGDLPYNQMMAAIDELEDIDANFGKGSDYDRMNAEQKFKVYQKKLEKARQNIIDNNPELWAMMQRDLRYTKKYNTLQSNRKPTSKGTAPARPSTKR